MQQDTLERATGLFKREPSKPGLRAQSQICCGVMVNVSMKQSLIEQYSYYIQPVLASPYLCKPSELAPPVSGP